ncbi:hypothetical protein NDA16_005051 [Ustilago loliicola]|nr:hypothetical protein NDA16_005051 [Ustilago loliicola]
MWTPLASASLVFLILYFVLFLFLAHLYILRKVPLLSRWLVLLLHVAVRLASQACGLSFGIVGYENIDLLVAYYILGAEGYFTLVVCTARFLIAWQRNHWGGYSWLEPIDPSKERGGWRQRFARMFQWKKSSKSASQTAVVIVDWLLAGANAIIIVGGSFSAAAYSDGSLSQSQIRSKLDAAKAMRAAGQAIFLAYFNSEVYDANNLTAQFVTEETCFVTMMEFISAAILASTYFTTRSRPSETSRA